MEKHTKENLKLKKDKEIFYFIIYGVVIAVFISLAIYGFITVNNRLRALEEQKPKQKCFTTQEEVPQREKRSTKPASRDDLLRRLVKVEERLNQSYQSVGRQPAFVLRGPPGKPGRDGIQGRDGTTGRDGSPGTNGRDGRDGAKGRKGDPGTRGQQGPRGISGGKGDQGSPGVTGVSYIRWGKKSCPTNGAKLVYEGHVGGSSYEKSGGGSNYVCLTRNPVYKKYKNGFQGVSEIFGAEYQTGAGIFPSSLHDHDVPCALCHVDTRATQMMIPGTNVCPAGWTREYRGYLMAEKIVHQGRTMYTCVEENPDYIQGTHVNNNGALFYFVEGRCGSLPCKPYVNGRELTCAVCTR